MKPQPCNRPRCKRYSVFSTIGMTVGDYEPRCIDHALEDLTRQADHLNARVAALTEMRAAGTLDLATTEGDDG